MLKFKKNYLLTAEQFNHLFKQLKGDFFETSFIYYLYDTEDLKYNKKDITLCICEKQAQFVCTITRNKFNSEFGYLEKTIEINSVDDDSMFKSLDLVFKGMMVIQRVEVISLHSTAIYLDRNIYLDTKDYELEIVYDSGNESDAIRLKNIILGCLEESGLCDSCLLNTPLTKSARFFARQSSLFSKRWGL